MDGERFIELAAAWTLLTATAVATLSGLAMLGPFSQVAMRHVALAASGPAVRVASLLVWGFAFLVPVGVLGAPVAVGRYRVDYGAYDAVAAVAWVVAALTAFPGVPLAWGGFGLVGAVVVGGVAGVAAVVGVDRLDRHTATSVRVLAPAQFAHVALFVLLLAGIVAGTAAGVALDALVSVERVQYALGGSPGGLGVLP